jgi:hypothetical protein
MLNLEVIKWEYIYPKRSIKVKNNILIFHTELLPPYHGRKNFVIIGCIRKSNKADMEPVKINIIDINKSILLFGL